MEGGGSVADMLVRARRGDRAVMSELIARMYRKMLHFARMRLAANLKLSVEATDIADEAALRLLKLTHLSCENEEHLENYFRAVVWSQCLNHLRRRTAEKRKTPGNCVPLEAVLQVEPERKATMGTVLVILDELAKDDNAFKMMKMYYAEEREVRDIARYFGVSVSAVYRDLKRAKIQLRMLLAPNGKGRTSQGTGAPRCIDHYRITRELGRGANGVVYRVTDAATGRPFAMKVLMCRGASKRLRWRFAHEVEIMQRLNIPGHSGVARFVHSGEVGAENPNGFESWCHGQPYYVMENIEGETLDRFITAKHSTRERLRVFARLCRAAEYLHLRNITHRDLKPSNLLVAPSGLPTIIDYGLAVDGKCKSTLVSDEGRFVGTLRYAAPEQRERKSALVGVRSDVYALGLILYEMLASKNYAGRALSDALRDQQVGADVASDPEDVAAFRYYLSAILATALAKRPADRFRHAGEFGQRVEELLARLNGRPQRRFPRFLSPTTESEKPLYSVFRREIAIARGAGHV